MRFRVTLIILAVLAALAPLALAGTDVQTSSKRKAPNPALKSPDLWATINVCDTALHPDTIGIRGSMPGLGGHRASVLWMRFRVQYLDRADNTWHNVTANADSGWEREGRTLKRVVEAGQNFTFQPPAAGGAHRLRGVVLYKWTRSGRVLLRAKRLTEGGHRSTAGADPEGYSAALCDIT